MISAVLRLLVRSPWARSALVSALRRPCSCVPPCGVGNGVAIGVDEGVDRRRPGHRPFHRALAIAVFGAAGEVALCDGVGLADLAVQEIEQAAGKFQHVFGRRLVLDQRRIAGPADLDAAEQIGLGLGHAVEPRRREMRVLAENLARRD